MHEDVVVKVDKVSKIFRLPHEKNSSIKSILINFQKRKKGFEEQHALSNVSFEIHRGDFFGIVGRNGGGKSTLLKLLAGIYSPTSGSVAVTGKLTPFIELGVGFNPELTGRENIFLNGALLGFERKRMLAMYSDIVRFAELEGFMDQKLKNYSSGMQVRLAFSIAIRAQSDILLLDEVLAVGDVAFQQKCYDYFEELKLAKKTVVFVSHDMSAIRRFCTKAVYIDHGKVTFEGDPLDIADKYSEDNMASIIEEQSLETRAAHQGDDIQISIVEHNKEKQEVRLKMTYKSKFKSYVGFSVIKDGGTFAEMNSLEAIDVPKVGSVEYILKTSMLNSGLYEVSAALINLETKQPLAMTKRRAKFSISGRDITRGGAIYLQDGWVR